MRDFTTFERHVVDQILEIDANQELNVIGNILSKRFHDGGFFITLNDAGKAVIRIDQEHLKQLQKQGRILDGVRYIVEQTSKDLFMAMKLIQYLESQGWIYTSGALSSLKRIGAETVNAKYIDAVGLDPEIGELLGKYIQRRITPTESLARLRTNGYRSDEEVRHERQMTLNRRALWVSGLSAVIAACAVIVAVFGTNDTRIVNLRDVGQQFAGMERNLESLTREVAAVRDENRATSKASREQFETRTHVLTSQIADEVRRGWNAVVTVCLPQFRHQAPKSEGADASQVP